MMNLLVTGGAGFIGSNLIRRIIDRPEVVRLVNLDCLTYAGHLSNLAGVDEHPKYVFEKVDLRDRMAVRRVVREHAITQVINLAAESDVDRSIDAAEPFLQTNVVGTHHLLEACRESWATGNAAGSAGRRFHHVSTDEVFGSLPATGAFNEQTHYAPNSPYSASKAASDILVRAWRQTFGLPTVITNCSNNYGPYQFLEKLVPVVIQCLVERRPIPVYGDGLNVRDWLHVNDHCDALWLALTRGRDGETYCLGGNCEWSNIRLVEFICDLADELRPELGGDSRGLIRFVEDRPGHDRRYAIDSTKAANELGWRPAISFESGMRSTVMWYLEHQDWVARVRRAR